MEKQLILLLAAVFCGAFAYPLDDEVQSNEVEIDVENADRAIDLSYLGKAIYGKPNEDTGAKIAEFDAKTAEANPEELGDYAEGDILFPGDARNGLISETYRWPNGVVPYEIIGPFTPQDLKTIDKAIEEYHKNTCIRLRLRLPTDRDYITITNTRTGCWSSVGKIGGAQQVNLQSPGCLSTVGTPAHELMHAIGFGHEQNRYERDEYVSIIWGNIQSGKDNNFKKGTKETTSGFGVPYDFGSVMHYSDRSFSVNGQPTIVAKTKGVTMGQRNGLSRGDIQKLNNMYCKGKDVGNNKGGIGSGLLSFLFG